MKLLTFAYEKIKKQPAPYYYNYSLLTIIGKPIRKWVTNVIAPNCVFNNIRILLYRMCGFKIGKQVFIGMHCYLDDMCYDLMSIGNNVIISYGVYFACHGRNQAHLPITIEDGAYIGMRASIISKNEQNPGGYYHLKECSHRCLHSCKQRYSCWSNGSGNPLQNNRALRDYIVNTGKEVLAICG